jgi:hypothetical protein
MMIFLVAIGLAGTVAAVAMMDDMVADLEDEARAAAEAQQAEQDAQAEVDQGGAEVGLPEWFSEAQAELDDLYQEEQDPLLDAGGTDAVDSAPEEGMVEAPIAPESDVDPVGWEDVLAEFEAAEDALAADLMAGAEAWAEDVISAEELEALPEPEGMTEVVEEQEPELAEQEHVPPAIADFVPSEDVLVVEGVAPEDVSLQEAGGHTQVMHGAEVLAVLEGVTGVPVEDILGTHHSDMALL